MLAPSTVDLISALIALVGLLGYALSANNKIQTLGERAFAVGLLAALLVLGLATHLR